MALIAVTGQPGCRQEEVARLSAQSLGFDFVNQARIDALVEDEFGPQTKIVDKAWPHVLASVLAHVATAHHMVIAVDGVELLSRHFPSLLRVLAMGPENVRAGTLMIERRLDRPSAKELLWKLEDERKQRLRSRWGKTAAPLDSYDLIMNAGTLSPDRMAELICESARALGLAERGYFSEAAEAQLQFQLRMRLARFGMVPAVRVGLPQKSFANQSEQVFANLLNFYRIAWEYEPRTFPLDNGEAFAPDFYLPEFNLYVELTTMKQSLVTKKNRKVRTLRALYPEINIQVFYQKDFENLVFKYGLARQATL